MGLIRRVAVAAALGALRVAVRSRAASCPFGRGGQLAEPWATQGSGL